MYYSGPWCRKEKGYVVGAGDYRHDRFGQEEVRAFLSVNIDHYSLSFLFFSFQVMLSCSCQLYEPIPLLPVFLRLTFIHLETILLQCIPAVDRPRSACARERQKPRSLSVSLSICFLRYQFPPKYVCAADLDY